MGAERDDKVMWTKHIDQTIANATRTLNFVHQNLCVASQNIKEMAYTIPAWAMPIQCGIPTPRHKSTK